MYCLIGVSRLSASTWINAAASECLLLYSLEGSTEAYMSTAVSDREHVHKFRVHLCSIYIISSGLLYSLNLAYRSINNKKLS